MRILALNYRDRKHPAAGGAEMHFHKIFSRIAAAGNDVVLFTTAFPGAPVRETIDGILVIRCGGDLAYQWNVARNFRKLDSEFHFDFVYEDLNKLPLFTPFLTRKPHLVQIHHLWRGSIFKEASFPVAFGVWLFETMIPLFYRRSHFVAVSPGTVQELVSLSIPEARISLVYNGADGVPADYAFPAEKDRYFLWLSRVHRYKGIFTALAAFKIFIEKHPDSGMKLRVAGRGPLLNRLPEITGSMGIKDSVVIEGGVSAERKNSLLAHALCLLQTSYKEGWGLTVIEAAERGTMTVASDVPGLRDSVQNGKTGLLFRTDTDAAEACASAMELVYEDPALRKKMESDARRYAASFSWDRAAKETLCLIQRIAGAK